VFLLYEDLCIHLRLSHLRLVWYWRPTKNNYPWCRRQAALNWKPWQHSACLSNPLALPEWVETNTCVSLGLFTHTHTCIKNRNLPNPEAWMKKKIHQGGTVLMDCFLFSSDSIAWARITRRRRQARLLLASSGCSVLLMKDSVWRHQVGGFPPSRMKQDRVYITGSSC